MFDAKFALGMFIFLLVGLFFAVILVEETWLITGYIIWMVGMSIASGFISQDQ